MLKNLEIRDLVLGTIGGMIAINRLSAYQSLEAAKGHRREAEVAWMLGDMELSTICQEDTEMAQEHFDQSTRRLRELRQSETQYRWSCVWPSPL